MKWKAAATSEVSDAADKKERLQRFWKLRAGLITVFLLICIRYGQKQVVGEYEFPFGVIKLLYIVSL